MQDYYGLDCKEYEGDNSSDNTPNKIGCNGNGVCITNFLGNVICQCGNSDDDGYFTGDYCQECQDNYYGTDCKTYCNDSEGDNNRNCFNGACNVNGECVCNLSDDLGYWQGNM